MSFEVICRDARIEDQSAIVEFQLAMALETEKLQLDRAVCGQGVGAVFRNPSLGKYYVVERTAGQSAEGSKSVVGSLLIIPEWSDWRNRLVWWIHSVYIVPEMRKKGVFSLFYRFIQEQGKKEDIRGLRLYVDRTNVNAQAVYQRLGMTNHHYELFEWMRDA